MHILSLIYVFEIAHRLTLLIIPLGDVSCNVQLDKTCLEQQSTILVYQFVPMVLMHQNKISNVYLAVQIVLKQTYATTPGDSMILIIVLINALSSAVLIFMDIL